MQKKEEEFGLSGWKFWLSGYRFSLGSSLTFDSQLAQLKSCKTVGRLLATSAYAPAPV